MFGDFALIWKIIFMLFPSKSNFFILCTCLIHIVTTAHLDGQEPDIHVKSALCEASDYKSEIDNNNILTSHETTISV